MTEGELWAQVSSGTWNSISLSSVPETTQQALQSRAGIHHPRERGEGATSTRNQSTPGTLLG